MFISGGENIHPEEIEQALYRLIGVEAAVVVPVPDAEFGFRSVAFIQSAAPLPTQERVSQLLAPAVSKFKEVL